MDESVLINAVKKNDLELVRELVEDIRADGSTIDAKISILIAISNGYYDVLKELLLIPSVRNIAVGEIAELIFENDDVIAYTILLNRTKLEYIFDDTDTKELARRMIRENKPNLLDLLLTQSRRGINILSNNYNPPLTYTAKHGGSIPVCEVLIEHGADPNEVNAYDEHVLTSRRDLEWIKFLVENGADINYRLTDNHTPLHEIIFFDDEIVNYALDQDGNVARQDNQGTSPLHNGIQDISLAILTRILNEYEVEIFAEISERGQTVLHELIDIDGYPNDDDPMINNVVDKLKVLFFYGVDFTMLNTEGHTPLQFMENNANFGTHTSENGRNEIIRILKEVMDPSLTLLSHRSIGRNNIDISSLPLVFTLW